MIKAASAAFFIASISLNGQRVRDRTESTILKLYD